VAVTPVWLANLRLTLVALAVRLRPIQQQVAQLRLRVRLLKSPKSGRLNLLPLQEARPRASSSIC